LDIVVYRACKGLILDKNRQFQYYKRVYNNANYDKYITSATNRKISNQEIHLLNSSKCCSMSPRSYRGRRSTFKAVMVGSIRSSKISSWKSIVWMLLKEKLAKPSSRKSKLNYASESDSAKSTDSRISSSISRASTTWSGASMALVILRTVMLWSSYRGPVTIWRRMALWSLRKSY